VPRVLGIRKRSSIDFVRRVFDAYRDGTLFALLDETGGLPEIPGYEAGEIVTPQVGGGWFEGAIVQRDSDDPAQIVFTSGTEGKPKAIVLSHRALTDVVERLNSAMRVDASIREHVGVPVTFSFGLGRCRAVAAAGGRFFLPERGFDPMEIRRMLEAEEINAISAVPTLFRILLQAPEVLGGFGSRVRWIEIGSQYMSRSEKEKMKGLFPNAVILQHYGLTEASRSTFLLISDTEGHALESVGRPFGRVEVQTFDNGRIRIRGPHLALGQVVDGKITPMVDADGWLTTGDNGHFEDESLFFDGRADDVINSGGIKVDPGHLEQDVRQRLKVERGVAVARISDPARGDGFFVGVQEGSGLDLRAVERAVHDALKERDIVAGPSVRVQEVREIPVTGTGKVQRKALAALHREETIPAKNKEHTHGAGVLALYEHMFDRDDIPATASFQDLGGDSLNYVQMTIALEKELGTLPPNWDNLPVSELDKFKGGARKRFAAIETNILLRVFAITCVVATHSGWDEFRGGTFLLFFLIGYNLARFKSSALSRGDIWEPMFSYTKVLLVPYFILSALLMVYNKTFYADLLFLYTNLTEWRFSLIFPFWFVQVLVQCLILTGGLFLIPAVRRFAANQPWPFALSVTTVLVAVWIVSPFVWNTDHLRNLVPQRYMALLWLGWCCHFANAPLRRLLALILGVGFAYMDTGIDQRAAWVVLGTVSVLYVPTVRVPSLLRDGLQIVASATFYIFVLNGVIAYGLSMVLGLRSDLVVFILTFFGSIAGWWAIERALELAHRFKLRLRPT
jgi:hypothetical protein